MYTKYKYNNNNNNKIPQNKIVQSNKILISTIAE